MNWVEKDRPVATDEVCNNFRMHYRKYYYGYVSLILCSVSSFLVRSGADGLNFRVRVSKARIHVAFNGPKLRE